MVDLKQIAKKWQDKWEAANIGKAERNDKPKFFIIWAYATVSGFQHTGHMRGYSYADAIARYKRMTGHNVLLTAGGHATGNGAISKAQKIKEKDQKWIDEFKSRGLSEAEIEKISDPDSFVDYFSQTYIKDYKEFGFLGDWQRFMVTTSEDYKKFITWQFHKLNEKNLLIQKPYFATACVKCGPVAVDPSEMDLSKGGTAEVNEYTLIKLAFGKHEDMNQFIMCATLRPETMYGQTNIWIDPELDYVKLKISFENSDEVWIVSKEAAEKLSYQYDNTEIIGKINAKEMLGKTCKAPMVNKNVYILPSEFCDPDIGTGIVTSVPSDAPHDYMGLYDLQNSEELCNKYGLNYELIKSIKIIPIINIPGYGESAAVDICTKLQIKNQHDPKLEEAKKEIYKLGFHAGVLNDNCGPFAGQKVTVAKDTIKEKLLADKNAELMRDLSEEVVCRCGSPVIIKRVDDQWFIKYSDEELTKKSIDHATKNMVIYPKNYAENVGEALEWFQDRPCARQGRWLGTPFPLDTSYIVEAISDSTLYPIYYLVSKYVNEGKLKVEDLSLEFFDYVFLGKGNVDSLSIDKELLQSIKDDVNYWYPLDINLGGKEHRRVHFPPFMMNHVAILPEDKWPKGIFVNEWVMQAKGEKLSKSKGGAQPIPDVADSYSVDAMRLFYANIGSPFADIYFNEADVINYKQRIEKIFNLISELINLPEKEDSRADSLLASRVNRAIKSATEFLEVYDIKKASDIIYMDLFRVFQNYKGGKELMPLLKSWIKMLALFTPHIAEELWVLAGEKDFVSTQDWPVCDESKIDEEAEAAQEALINLKADIRKVLELAKIEKPEEINLFLPEIWKYELIKLVKEKLEVSSNPKDIIGAVMATDLKKQGQQVMKIIPGLIKDRSKLPEVLFTPENELAHYEAMVEDLRIEFNCEIKIITDSQEPKAKQAMPGKPAILVK